MNKNIESLFYFFMYMMNVNHKNQKTNKTAIIVDAHLGDFMISLNFIDFIIHHKEKGSVYIFVSRDLADYLLTILKWTDITIICFDEFGVSSGSGLCLNAVKKIWNKRFSYAFDEIYLPYTNMWSIKFSCIFRCHRRYLLVHTSMIKNGFKYNMMKKISDICITWNSQEKMLFEAQKDLAVSCGYLDYCTKVFRYSIEEGDKQNQYGAYCVVAPGCTNNVRSWEINKFEAIIGNILNETSLNVLISGGKDDKNLANEIEHHWKSPRVINTAGKTSYQQLNELLNNAVFLLANDTGIIHVAAAIGTPTFYIGTFHNSRCVPYVLDKDNDSIFKGIWTKEELTCKFCEVPYAQKNIKKIPCLKCKMSVKRNKKLYCVTTISVEMVWEVIKTYLFTREYIDG